MATSFKCAPNGLEMSRPASQDEYRMKMLNLGWPGRLHRVVRPLRVRREGDGH